MHVVALTVQGRSGARGGGRREAGCKVQDLLRYAAPALQADQRSRARFSAEMQRTEQVQGVRRGRCAQTRVEGRKTKTAGSTQ